jgi:hypothetical protein
VVLQIGLPGVQQGFISLLQQMLAEAAAIQTPGR